jgi:hypothetical protein
MWRFTNPGNAVWALVILLLSAGQWCMYAQRRIGIKSSFLLISGDIGFLAVLITFFIAKRVRVLRCWLSLHIAAVRITGLTEGSSYPLRKCVIPAGMTIFINGIRYAGREVAMQEQG